MLSGSGSNCRHQENNRQKKRERAKEKESDFQTLSCKQIIPVAAPKEGSQFTLRSVGLLSPLGGLSVLALIRRGLVGAVMVVLIVVVRMVLLLMRVLLLL